MTLFRNRAFMAAVAVSVIVAMYLAFVAGRAVAFMNSGEPLAAALGAALLVLGLDFVLTALMFGD